jgi:hypothetical protein
MNTETASGSRGIGTPGLIFPSWHRKGPGGRRESEESMNEKTLQAAGGIRVAGAQAEDLPLKVVRDWDEQVPRASVR